MKDIQQKCEREKKMVSRMIRIYCNGNHGTRGNALCKDCVLLKEYARLRSDKCPFMETKTFCSNCRVHCYKPDMRQRIKAVMRYAGPRMLLHNPVVAIGHVIESKREKKRLERENEG